MSDRPEEYLNTSATQDKVLPVYEEQLAVGKQRVDTGKGVRVIKTVVNRPQLVDEVLRHEDVQLSRVPVDTTLPRGEVPVTRYEGDTLIVPIVEEVLVVEKRLRVKEELHITKNVTEEKKSETVLLKSEEVSIERFDDETTGGK